MVAAAIAGDIPIILKISLASAFLLFAFFTAGSFLKKVKLAQRPLQNRAVNTLHNLLEELEAFEMLRFESSLKSIAKMF